MNFQLLAIALIFVLTSSQEQKNEKQKKDPTQACGRFFAKHKRVCEMDRNSNVTTEGQKIRKIVVGKSDRGLTDRETVIRAMLYLAKRTCSRVYFPPPCQMLSEYHNNGNKVSCHLEWSDFWDLSQFSNLILTIQPLHANLRIHNYYYQCQEFWRSVPSSFLIPPATYVLFLAKQFVQRWLHDRFSYVHLRFGGDNYNCDQSSSAILSRLSNLTSTLQLGGKGVHGPVSCGGWYCCGICVCVLYVCACVKGISLEYVHALSCYQRVRGCAGVVTMWKSFVDSYFNDALTHSAFLFP